MKKMFSLALALIMALALTVPAFAVEQDDAVNAADETTGQITVTNAVTGETYDLYRLLDLESYDKTAGAYATGMGVTKDEATGVVTIPAKETGVNLYVLDKERIPTGANAARVDMSDYDPNFNTFAAGELCKIQGFVANEKFAVDQYDAVKCIAGNAGKYAAVGTDGKWTIAGADTDSEYVFLGLHNDAGHTLALIECVKAVGKNA